MTDEPLTSFSSQYLHKCKYTIGILCLSCNVESSSQIVLKRAETDINPIVLNGVLYHVRNILLHST